jgi:hypothetical protein
VASKSEDAIVAPSRQCRIRAANRPWLKEIFVPIKTALDAIAERIAGSPKRKKPHIHVVDSFGDESGVLDR